jgi:hypothetical protein
MRGYRFLRSHHEKSKNKEECLMVDDKSYDKATDKNDSGEMPERDRRLMEDTEFWRLNVAELEDGKFERI